MNASRGMTAFVNSPHHQRLSAAHITGGKNAGDAGHFILVGLNIGALVEFNAELRRQLKKDGLLMSDARVKERKKYGLAGARERFQFSKR